MPVPDGLKDALAREGGNMRSGAQDAYDRFLGVQPAGDHNPHTEWDYWPDQGEEEPALGPAPSDELSSMEHELQGYSPPAYESPGLDTEPMGPEPASGNEPQIDIGMDR